VEEAQYEVDAGVAVVAIDASERRNALTPELAGSVIELLQRAANDPAVGALLLRTEGPSFCAGADLRVVRAAMPDPLEPRSYDGLGQIYDLFRALVGCPLPTIVAVQGPAVGAGVNLALACDVRIVSSDAQFIGFGVAGVHPGGGHLELLRAVDRQAAAWLALCNQAISAEEAVALRLAIKVTPPDALNACALAVAKAAAVDPGLSRLVTSTFRTIDGIDPRHDAAVKIERAPQVWSLRRLHNR
jgi:enoyl-CoA hydratase